MNAKLNIVFFAVLLLFASACETIYWSQGSVYSAENEQPLENVLVRLKLTDSNTVMDSVYTNSKGLFKVQSGAAGCVPNCPKASIEFVKEDFAILTLEYLEIDPELKDSLIVKLKPE
jgi:hypothetical protein